MMVDPEHPLTEAILAAMSKKLDPERCYLVDNLFRPLYVIQMGWDRMGKKARYRWVRRLQVACIQTTLECDTYLKIHHNDK